MFCLLLCHLFWGFNCWLYRLTWLLGVWLWGCFLLSCWLFNFCWTLISFHYLLFLLYWHTIIKYHFFKILYIYFLTHFLFTFLFSFLLCLNCLRIRNFFRSIQLIIILLIVFSFLNFCCCRLFACSSLRWLTNYFWFNFFSYDTFVSLNDGWLVIYMFVALTNDSAFSEVLQSSLIPSLLHEHQLLSIPFIKIGRFNKRVHNSILPMFASTVNTEMDP